MKIYFDFRDWWIGYYRGDRHHYVCLLPTVVIRWNRKVKSKPPAWIDPNMFLGMPVVVRDWVPKDKAYLINQKPFDFIGKPVFDEALHVSPDTWKLVQDLMEYKWPNNPA